MNKTTKNLKIFGMSAEIQNGHKFHVFCHLRWPAPCFRQVTDVRRTEKREGNWETGRCGVAQSMNFVQSSTKLVKEQEIYL